jgi:hypothetical protein
VSEDEERVNTLCLLLFNGSLLELLKSIGTEELRFVLAKDTSERSNSQSIWHRIRSGGREAKDCSGNEHQNEGKRARQRDSQLAERLVSDFPGRRYYCKPKCSYLATFAFTPISIQSLETA